MPIDDLDVILYGVNTYSELFGQLGVGHIFGRLQYPNLMIGEHTLTRCLPYGRVVVLTGRNIGAMMWLNVHEIRFGSYMG